MTKYFIDLRDSGGFIRHEEGADFDHLEDALEEAKASARDLVGQYMDTKVPLIATCVEVRNQAGKILATLTVAEVLAHPVHPEFKNRCADIPYPGHR
jgi:hypothetical protein